MSDIQERRLFSMASALTVTQPERRLTPTEQPYPNEGEAGLNDDPINILVVDDEPKNLTVLETILDDPGYRLIRATSADQALLALMEKEFALLILDIQMPVMTGFELAQMIKGRKKTAQVPIIFLTAYYNEDQHMIEGYSSGAVDYLHKPINAGILRSKVAVFAELHRKSRTLRAEVNERHLAQEQLRELNENLEQRVIERTEALARTSAALSETLERYHALFDGSLDAISLLDSTDGRFDSANPAMLQLTGRSLEELQTLHFFDLCPPDKIEPARQAFQSAFRYQAITLETPILTASGQRRDLFISCAPMLVEGKLVGIACIARDITERNRAEQEVKQALAAAEKANQAKSNFLSSMSHELRTPLNAILGFAQLLEGGVPPPSATQILRINQIIKAGWYLLELINEILDLAVIESGRLTVTQEAVPLAAVLTECQAMIETQAQKYGITINYLPVDSGWLLNADRTRIKQVLLNLLSNAIKYNREKGSVEVKCSGTAERVRISIKDTGEGMSENNLAQLFQAFNRLGRETSGEEGTGIGLVVTKQLVEIMGGTIGVESTLGVGSEFWVELNRYVAPDLEQSQAHTENNLMLATKQQNELDSVHHTLLYVEDNAANLLLIEQMMQGHQQVQMLSARDGMAGVEVARAHHPNVILMDINLPGMSGLEVLKVLREDPALEHTPVIALSADAMPHDIERGVAAGFFCYLTKPIKIKEFMSALDDALKFSDAHVKRQAVEKRTRVRKKI
jgi:PAS domain S-box-containing protein